MPARWNDELTCKYVELYKEHECLWNMNSVLYRRKDARQSALEEIVRKMGLENFTTEDAKQKIKSLRATYQQESHKIDKSLSSGAGLEDVYKPSMKWFTLMTEVMKSGVLKRGTVSSEFPQQENLQTWEYDAEVDLVQTGDKVNKSDIVAETNVKAPENVNDIKQPAASLPTSTPCPKKKRTLLREVSDTVRELKTLDETISRPEREAHECDVFAAHIARQLKQLNAASCILAQQDIQGVMTRYRMRDLLSEESGHFSCQSPYSTSQSNYESSSTSPAQSQHTNKDFPVLHTLTQRSGEAANCLSELVSDVLSGLSEDSHS